MTKKIESSEVDVSSMTVADALAAGLVRLTSDLPQTNGDLSRLVEKLVRETTLSYADIVAKVREEFPHARTSTKSVASVACCMRRPNSTS